MYWVLSSHLSLHIRRSSIRRQLNPLDSASSRSEKWNMKDIWIRSSDWVKWNEWKKNAQPFSSDVHRLHRMHTPLLTGFSLIQFIELTLMQMENRIQLQFYAIKFINWCFIAVSVRIFFLFFFSFFFFGFLFLFFYSFLFSSVSRVSCGFRNCFSRET